MRLINGYVCVAGVENASYTQEVLFGKSVTERGKRYENLQTNGLMAYDTLSEAFEASYDLQRANGFSRVDVKTLRMLIADRLEELDRLRKEGSLVVIKLEKDPSPGRGIVHWRLLGPRVKGRPDVLPLPGAQIGHTGFATFRSFDEAIGLGKEVNRQGDCGFQLASFQLKEINIRRKSSVKKEKA